MNLTEDEIRRLIGDWWQAQKESETERKTTSVELSGVLPDGSKFAIKEYAANSRAAYAVAAATFEKMRQDHPAK